MVHNYLRFREQACIWVSSVFGTQLPAVLVYIGHFLPTLTHIPLLMDVSSSAHLADVLPFSSDAFTFHFSGNTNENSLESTLINTQANKGPR